MCSVVGYVGSRLCKSLIIEGLSRLEYRGYDSAGFACISSPHRQLQFSKTQGRLEKLVNHMATQDYDGHIGIGHTRWATHGVSSADNAHPQFDCTTSLAVVHNGIIENYHEQRKELIEQGHIFSSQTDTEVVAHLLEQALEKTTDLKSAAVDMLTKIEGAFAFVALMKAYPDFLLIVRRRSPLCVGIAHDEYIVASDVLAFAGITNQVIFLPDMSFALVSKAGVTIYDFTGKEMHVEQQAVSDEWRDYEKDGHEHYMIKEIYEQKPAIYHTVSFLKKISPDIWNQIHITTDQVKALDHIEMVACGTSWHAARIAQFFFESIAMIPTRVHLASEFRYMPFFPQQNALYLTISQSGETADTLEALRMIAHMNKQTVAVTNVVSSTIVREADGFLLTQHEREIAVASTKAFSTQLALLYWLAHRIALEKGIIQQKELDQAEQDLLKAAQVLEDSLEQYKGAIVETIAPQYAQYDKAIFLGRHISYPFAMEAALKLKEVAYIFSQCYPAGELKHGPLALVDEHLPVFVFSHQDRLVYQKLLSNAQEVKARGGKLVVFAFEGQEELIALADTAFTFPPVKPLLGCIAMAGVMQFLVYAIAKKLGCAIDNPRNLAKSVTVE